MRQLMKQSRRYLLLLTLVATTVIVLSTANNAMSESESEGCFWSPATKQCTPDEQIFVQPVAELSPTDTVLYEDMQRGLAGDSTEHGMGWLQGHARGISDLRPGADEAAQSLGLQPEACMQGLFDTQTETAFMPVYREWARLMRAGLNGERAYG